MPLFGRITLSLAMGLISLNAAFAQQPVLPVSSGNAVAVVGSVTKPGLYSTNGQSTVLSLLAQAGGLTRSASETSFIYRADASGVRHETSISLIGLISGRQSDIKLQPGDTLYIPSTPPVSQ
jgi:protein involved in polysaccharide export with SLBB domain